MVGLSSSTELKNEILIPAPNKEMLVKRLIHIAIVPVVAAIALAATGAPASAQNLYLWSPHLAGTGGIVDSQSAGPQRAAGANWIDCSSAGFVRTWYDTFSSTNPTGFQSYVTDSTCGNGYTYTPILSQKITSFKVCEYRRTDGSLIACTPWA
jgi:hypothetical protein